ncbi:putative quinol monooxygenase [Streptomyces sp. NPDC054794]
MLTNNSTPAKRIHLKVTCGTRVRSRRLAAVTAIGVLAGTLFAQSSAYAAERAHRPTWATSKSAHFADECANSSGFALVVDLYLKDAAAARAYDELVARTVPKIQANEPNTLVYTENQPVGGGINRVQYELYRDKAAFTFHSNASYVQKYVAEREKYIVGYKVTKYCLVRGFSRGSSDTHPG